MFECVCGKSYKYAGGLNKHKEKCGAGGGAAAGGGDDDDDVAQSQNFTVPLTSFKPTASFTKDDLEMLEKRKQSRLNAILQAQKEETKKKVAQDTAAAVHAEAKAIITAAAAAASAKNRAGGGGANGNTTNVGNEEHNASFNINYVKRSEETQQVVRAVTAAAHQYCKGRIIVTSDEPAPGGGALSGISTSVNENGTTVYNHPTRTISIIETPPEEVSPEEEHDITLEKMTYLILSLIQNNNKLTKENQVLRSIVARIDPSSFD
jgi:hypothetical protein